MFLKNYNPTTPGVRHKKVISRYTLNSIKLNLLTCVNKNGCKSRDSKKHLVFFNKSFTRKNRYAIINFNRVNVLRIGIVCSIFKQKWNSTFLSLIKFATGAFSYVINMHGMRLGEYICPLVYRNNRKIRWYKPGSFIMVKYLPKNAVFSNICGSNTAYVKYVKSAGTFSRIYHYNTELGYIIIKLPAGSLRYLSYQMFVTLGRNSNIFHKKEIVGKAGYNRNLGWKPKVRGVAKNPVDHPHGGRTKTNKPEVSPWGWVTKKNK